VGWYLGCDTIFCAGLDLGFPGGCTHYRGSYFEETIHTVSDRLRPGEDRHFAYLYSAGPFLSANYDGDHTVTDKRMVLYKWWFEDQMKQQPQRVTYTLCKKSVRIEHFQHIEIEKVLELDPCRKDIERIIEEIHPLGSAEKGENKTIL
jgi:hypothetical protein